MEKLFQDIRYGLRMLWKSPGFTLVSVLTLALGVGVNTALFSVVNEIILRPLPFKDSSQLAMMWTSLPSLGFQKIPFSPSDYSDLVQSQHSFQGMAIFENQKFDLTGEGRPEQITGARVSASLFPVLGVSPLKGRTFLAEEDQPGREQEVVLSYSLWQQHFGSDQSIVGKNISLNRQPYTVIGVMPRGFEFPLHGPSDNQDPAQVFVPAAFTPTVLQMRGAMYQYSVIARLKPGVTIREAQHESQVLGSRVEKNYPPEVLKAFRDAELSFLVDSYHNAVAGEVRTPMLIMLGAVALVLLIACANVANLLLSRGAVRQRELAIRSAMGANRARLVRQMLTESLLLALAGSAVGIFLAKLGKDLLLKFLPASVPHPDSINLNAPVFAFALILCLLATLIFGLVSVSESSRISLQQILQESTASGTAVRRRRRMQGFFVVSEFAFALGLLIAAGLLLRSFSKLLKVDPGFQPDRVLSMTVSLPKQPYTQADQLRNFYRDLIARVATLPGVSSAGLSSDLPLSAQETETVHEIDGHKVNSASPLPIHRSWVMGDYLTALKVPLIKGRLLGPEDLPNAQQVAVISQQMAQRFWPGQDVLGKQLKVGPSAVLTIVGVVGDVKDGPLETEPIPHIYTPYLQESDKLVGHPTWTGLRSMNLVVASQSDPANLISPIQSLIWSLDPQLTTTNVSTLKETIQESVLPQRFNMFLLLIFAGVAVFLAMVGIYGVISYAVTYRTREIGVRIALGAKPATIFGLILRDGAMLALWGAMIGVGVALGLGRLLRSLLFGIGALDPLTFIGAATVLVLVALFACFVPARKAMRINPIAALRHE
jgi:putative ABC transport system permease protein